MTFRVADIRNGGTEFGIFYPKEYLLAVYADAADCDRAVAALVAAGFATPDLVVATGSEVLAYSRELRAEHWLLVRFERFVAGLYGDESTLADELVALAERDHVFVAVYASDDAMTTRAADAARAFAPVVLRKFDALTFTDLR